MIKTGPEYCRILKTGYASAWFMSLLYTILLLTIVWIPEAQSQHLYMRRVENEKGGVQAHDIYSVFQDSRYYIWFSTDAGVWRFDGKEYMAYTTANGLPDNVVFSLTEDQHQRIWLRMYSNKLAYIHSDKVTVLPCSNKLAQLKRNEVITSLQVGKGDTVYLSYLNSPSIIKIAPPYREQDIHQTELHYNSTHFIYETPSGEILLGKSIKPESQLRRGITVFSQNKKEYFPFKSFYQEMPRVMVAPQKDKTYLLGVGNLLYSYSQGQLKELLSFDKSIMHAQYDQDHHLWVSVTEKGLCLYRNDDTSFRHPEIYLMGAVPNAILQDKEGSYWISTLKNGIYYVPYSDINLLNSQNGLSENISYNYYEPSTHDLYCFAQGTLYILHNQKIRKIIPINIRPSEKNEICCVMPLGKNELVCLGRHSFVFDKTNFRFHPIQTGSGQQVAPIRSVCGLVSGDSVFFSMHNRIAVWKKNRETTVLESFDSRISFIKKHGKNLLLVGTEDGLYLYDLHLKKQKKIDFLPAHSSVKGVEHATALPGFFIVMKNGTVYLTDEHFSRMIKKLTRAEGHAVKSVYQDSNGLLWIATSNGIYLLDHQSKIKNINRAHGLPTNLLNNITVAQDTVFVASEDGLVTFPFEKTFFNDSPPVLYYKGTSINGVDRGNRTRYELGHNENFIKINYQALHYRINSDVECRYFLHGIDYHWQTTHNNTIEYTTLPPGDYIFEMYAINNDGVKSTNTVTLFFTILPPFWKTWWFILVIVSTLTILVSFIFILRVRQIKKRESEKNELTRKIAETEMQALRSQMNPHFIFNAINSIQHLVLINEPLSANYYLTKFSKLMRNVLEQSRRELIPLEEELENIQLYLTIESLRFEGKFNYQVILGQNIQAEKILVPPMIIQPFIENAIWHGLLLKQGDKKLVIELYTDGDHLQIVVDDNGIGREAAKKYASTALKKESLGMKITMERLHLLEKNQQIKTFIYINDKYNAQREAQGTQAVIQLPIIHITHDQSSYYR